MGKLLKALSLYLSRILGWIAELLGDSRSEDAARARRAAPFVVAIKPFGQMTTEPPPMNWAPCHPSTIHRFKASITCPRGHSLTLKAHSVAANGLVSPSVVCPAEGCDFHELVRLEGWNYPQALLGRHSV